MSQSSVLDPVVSDPETENEDGHLTHILRKGDWERGYILGEPVTALCGFTWVPYRNPDKYPPCERCIEVAEKILGSRAN